MQPVVKFALIDMACVAGLGSITGLFIWACFMLFKQIYANRKQG